MYVTRRQKVKFLSIVIVLMVLVITQGGSTSAPRSGADFSIVQSIQLAINTLFHKKTPDTNSYTVEKVIDGDTIDVLMNGKKERVRLIGINTPETVDPRRTVECFGKEASDRSKSILTGAQVRLKADSSQDNRDKYGRLLRYVFLEDGTNFNEAMIKDGFAYEYTYNVPYKYQVEFKNAQASAKENKVGLWGSMCQ